MNLSFIPETNWVDIIVVIFLIRGGYIGLGQGFSAELFKTLGAITATVVSLLYYERVGEWLSSHSFLSLQAARIITFLVLFFSLLIVFKLVRILLFKVLHFQFIGSNLERWGGFSLGLLRSVIFASLFCVVLTMIPVDYIKKSVEKKSFFGPYLNPIAPKVLEFIVMFKPKTSYNEK